MMRIHTSFTVLLVMTTSAYAQVPAPPAQAVETFVQHVDREWPGESQQQALTRDSLRLLADAVADLARRHKLSSSEFERELQALRDATARYAAGTPGDASQSRQLRKTLETAADLVRTLAVHTGAASSIDARLNALERSAESLDRDQPLRRQPDVLERFFHHAAETLKAVSPR